MSSLIVVGQIRIQKKANLKYDNLAYIDAIESYEALVENGIAQDQIYKRLANANYQNANYQESAKWYQLLFAMEPTSYVGEDLYKYGVSLRSIGDFETSKIWMEKFSALYGTEETEDQNSLVYLKKINQQSGQYSLKELSINSEESDFAPSYYLQQLVFASTRDTGIIAKRINVWDKKSFLNLYANMVPKGNDDEQIKLFSKDLRTKAHESSTAFTKDGTTVYFTRNNFHDGDFGRDKSGISRLKILRADLVDNKWTNITSLPFNSDDYSVAHPALSADEKTLFFSSDMPGTIGSSDIFKVAINTDGTFGAPTNLGPHINTPARETFPHITPTNILYFASDGHPGLGGLDLFATELKVGKKLQIINLPRPINSEQDDFSLIINESEKSGYFASNRIGGMGSDDIYEFMELAPVQFSCYTDIKGWVTDRESGKKMATAVIKVMSLDNNKEYNIQNVQGNFQMNIDCDFDSLIFKVEEEGYESASITVSGGYKEVLDSIVVSLQKKTEPFKVGTDLFKVLNLNPIYFDSNSSNIKQLSYADLDKIVQFLKENPQYKIQVRSHSDSRGSDTYNQWLSEKRAESTVQYFTTRGIEDYRVSGKGFGETQLLNECSNRVKCSTALHEINRRSEFIVVE
ncbi:OmpA family protein [Arenibacter nanhaiticus]|nr:OmpA family protein [Arenibacter nanhaiticus]